MTSEIPRRIRLDLNTPAELAIRAAVDAVEALPADVRLTDAVVLLGKASERVADFVDNVPRADTEGDRPMKASEKLRSALIGILELGRKDTSNEKYDGYYESAEAAIRFADTEGDRPMPSRLTWLADRVQAQHSQLWPSKDNPYTLSHDRLMCDDPDHAGCHLYALIELVRKLAAPEGDTSPAPWPWCRICQGPCKHAAVAEGHVPPQQEK